MAGSRTTLLILFLSLYTSPGSSTSLNELAKKDDGSKCEQELQSAKDTLASTTTKLNNLEDTNSALCNEIEDSKSDIPSLLFNKLHLLCSRNQPHTIARSQNSKAEDTNPAFTVELSSDQSLSHNVPITFDTRLMDPSDSFTPLLGTFQCPDDGLYVFYWTISAPEGRVAAELVKEGVSVKYGPLTSAITGSFSGSSSMSSVLECSEGEMVWLKAVGWPDEEACNKIEGVYSSFSGFRLSDANEDAVAFTAELSANTTTTTPIYNNTIINEGNAYDPDTGQFTCPSDGVYVLTQSAHVSSDFSHTYIRIDGSQIANGAYARNTESISTDSGTSTGTCIMECKEGEVITATANDFEHMAQVSSLTGYRIYDNINGTVAFTVRLQSDEQYRDGQKIYFRNLITNTGERYRPNSGMFICPDSNLYLFMWSVMTSPESSGRACEARLMTAMDFIEEDVKFGPRTSEVLTSTWGSSSSTQVVAQCEPERAFYIQAVLSDSEWMAYYSPYTTFSGFRLP